MDWTTILAERDVHNRGMQHIDQSRYCTVICTSVTCRWVAARRAAAASPHSLLNKRRHRNQTLVDMHTLQSCMVAWA